MPEDSPWLEMLVNEDQLLSQIVTLCSQNGWDIVDEFHKVVYSSRLVPNPRFSASLFHSSTPM